MTTDAEMPPRQGRWRLAVVLVVIVVLGVVSGAGYLLWSRGLIFAPSPEEVVRRHIHAVQAGDKDSFLDRLSRSTRNKTVDFVWHQLGADYAGFLASQARKYPTSYTISHSETKGDEAIVQVESGTGHGMWFRLVRERTWKIDSIGMGEMSSDADTPGQVGVAPGGQPHQERDRQSLPETHQDSKAPTFSGDTPVFRLDSGVLTVSKQRFRDTSGTSPFAFSADSQRVLLSQQNGDVCLWDIRSGRCLTSLHLASVASDVQLSAKGHLALTAAGKSLAVWDILTGERLWEFHGGGTVHSPSWACKILSVN